LKGVLLMMVKCSICGLLEEKNGENICFRLNKKIEVPDKERDCTFFTEKVYEDGGALSPYEHLLLYQNDQRKKGMRGPLD